MINNQAKNNKPSSDNPFDKPKEGKKRRRSSVSEYKKSLTEKQALKNLYGLSEKQFKRYVKESLDKMQRVENVSDELIKKLEKRLDNVVFRLGFAKTRVHARQMVNHSYFLVNGKSVNIPSFEVGKGDIISLKESKKKKPIFEKVSELAKKNTPPSWLNFDREKFSAESIGEPSLAEVNPPVEISLIFEFYSR
mgnify:CR=1 FL=1